MSGRNTLELTYRNKLLGNNKVVLKPCPCGCRKFWVTTSLNSKKIGKGRVKEELKKLMRMDKEDWSNLTLIPTNYGKPEISKKERCTADDLKSKTDSKEVLVEGRFSDSEPEPEGTGLTFKLAPSNEPESEK